MKIRLCLLGLLFLFLVAAVQADPPRPNAILQIKPLDEWQADAKYLAKQLGPLWDQVAPAKEGGRPAPPDPEKQIDEAIAQAFGVDWRDTIDTTKPFGAYAIFQERIENTAYVLMLPFKSIKVLPNILATRGIMGEEKDGLYSFKVFFEVVPLYARSANGYVYVGSSADAVAAENLLKPADVFSSAVKSNLLLRLRLDLIPDALKQKAVEELSKSPEDVPEAQSEALKKLAKEFADSLQMAARDGQECTIGVEFDRKSGELTIATELAPKPGTVLAKEYRQARPTTSRFAELAKDAAVFIGQTAAVPLAPFGDDLSKQSSELQKGLEEVGIKFDEATCEKLLKVIRKAIESDVTDAALAVYVGPNGKGTGLITVPIKDGAKVDAELRAIIESCPPETREQFKFNVGKIGNGNLHQMNFAKGLPDNMKRVIDSDKLQFLLAPDAAFIAIGSEAEARLKAAIAAKPGPVPMVIIEASLVKLWPLVEQTAKSDADRAELEKTRERIGKGVDKIRFLHLTRTAGETIHYRLGTDLVSVLKVILTAKGPEPAPQPKER